MSIVTAGIFGATWWNEGTVDSEIASIKDVQNIIGNLYAGLSFLGVLPRASAAMHACLPACHLDG